ncbi:hypothetical protein PENSUB_4856 [Penicillium subrubescens]|jgi:uncharacterized protein YhhL (DUF1145 family)|uniref:Uncharacterized protein n=1 Tax=Penicillium subrubescens TaxID=1316194 RepID=A0A1Q5UBB3_9EURO|nr:hypothetical protein PENSUB_4856 [Penicillium subrubescens]
MKILSVLLSTLATVSLLLHCARILFLCVTFQNHASHQWLDRGLFVGILILWAILAASSWCAANETTLGILAGLISVFSSLQAVRERPV